MSKTTASIYTGRADITVPQWGVDTACIEAFCLHMRDVHGVKVRPLLKLRETPRFSKAWPEERTRQAFEAWQWELWGSRNVDMARVAAWNKREGARAA